MAQELISKKDDKNIGMNLKGYYDYRGTTVIGTWLWDSELGLGITTEIDFDEAYVSYNQSLLIIGSLIAFSCTLILITLYFFNQNSKWLNGIIKLKTRELEDKMIEVENLANAKADFLANMSHEIRTPMNGVLGMTELLHDSPLNANQKHMVGTIKSCGESLLTIINDILDFSKIENEKLHLEITPFSIKPFICDIIFLFKNALLNKNIRIKSDIDKNIPTLLGDTTRIRQVLSNFISNAIKFSDKNEEITITIRCTEVIKSQVTVTFQVKDNGIGIKKEDQGKLFTAFTQADITTTRQFGGTGLGLAICAKLVGLMKGKIVLESEYNIGTTMSLNLSLKVTEKQIGSEPQISKSLNSICKDVPLKILLVEDNLVNQKLALMMLNKLGHQCSTALNGEEALKNMKSKTFDLIFMDMMMPVMDGVTATKEIVNMYGKNRPYIVAMTANVFKEDKEKCFDAGMDDFISKPVSLNDFSRITNQVKLLT